MNADLADLDFGNLINHFINRRKLGDQSIATLVNERFGRMVQVSRSTVRNWRNKSDTNIQDWKQLAAVATVLDLSEEEVSLLLMKGGLPTLEKLWSEASKEERALLQKWVAPAPLQSIDSRLETIASSVDEIRSLFPKSETPTGLDLTELESRYLRAAAEEWAYLDIETGARVPLRQVYVMLEAMRSTRPSPVSERDDMAHSHERNLNAEASDQSAKTEPPRPMPLADVINKHQHLVILGEAGAGKSTTLQSIALALTGEQNQLSLGLEDVRIPVLVRLREHEATLAEVVLESVLAVAVRPFLGISIVDAQNLVERWRDENRLAVLLDGLDELSEDGRRQALQAIRGFVPGRGKTCRMIITSRITGYQDLGEPLREFALKPFVSAADALPYATGWLVTLRNYSIGQADEAEKEAQALLKQMEGHPSLKGILDNPLYFRLALEIYVREERLVQNRADLYQTAVESVAWRRAENRSIEFSKTMVVNALQCIAWAIHVEGKRERSALIKALSLADFGADSEALLEALRTKMGLILLYGEAGDRNVAFSHKTFQEYLVAQRLAAAWQKEGNRDNAWAFLRPRLHHPDWHEAILLMAIILAKDTVTQFVKFIFDAQSPFEGILHRDLRLSVELMSSGIDVDDNIVEQIMNRIRQILSKRRSLLDFLRFRRVNNKIIFLITSLGDVGSERVTSTLIPLLQDKDNNVRRRAVIALGQIGGETAVAALQAALQHEDSHVRWRAVDALGQIGGEAVVAALQAALQHEDSHVRGRVVLALRQIGGETAFTTLKAALQDDDSDVRSRAVLALGQIGGETAFAALQAAVQDKDSDVRSSAVDALGQIGGETAVAALKAALQDEDNDVRRRTVDALGQIGGETAVVALQAALQDKDSDVRSSAVDALGQIGGETAVAALKAALQDEDNDVRRRTVDALGQIGGETAVSALQAALQDEDSYVCWRAARALGQIGGETAVAALQAALQDEDRHVRRRAVDALRQIGGETAVAALQAALQDEDSYVRRSAVDALGQIGGETAVSALQAALQDEDSYVRRSAVDALGQIGGETAVSALQAALQYEDRPVRRRAATILGQIGGETAITALQAALQDEDSYVRRSAVDALGQIGGDTAVAALQAALQHEDSDMRWRAATILGQIGGETAITALERALQDEDSNVRWSAVVLRQIGGETAVAALQAALQHEDGFVRWRAVDALGQIGDETAVAALQATLQHEDNDVRRRTVKALGEIGGETAVAALQAALQDDDITVRWSAVAELKAHLFSMSYSSLKRLINQLQRLQFSDYLLFGKAIVRLTELQVEELKHTDPFTPPSLSPGKRTMSTIAIIAILGLIISVLALLTVLSKAVSGFLETEFEQALDVLSSDPLWLSVTVVILALLTAVLGFAANKLRKRVQDKI
ncbi:MAG: HEAT repeat domain-containing protein [Anaerolineaceae bacterium]|nr:HEAT repeat domain-containing protein [Anaerolineaceae bacterium]